jgi:hypothetical protein
MRMGVWEYLVSWSGKSAESVEPRLAMQLINESALCVTGIRQQRCLNHKGFDPLNGLPFIASDTAIHNFLDTHTVEEYMDLQVKISKMRSAMGHYLGKTIAIDPHRTKSYSDRDMPKRCAKADKPSEKTGQFFFAIDADTSQPICCGIGSSALSASDGFSPLLKMGSQVIPGGLILADAEHYATSILNQLDAIPTFRFLAPLPKQKYIMKRIQEIPEDSFQRYIAGYAIACIPYKPANCNGEYQMIVQRYGEKPTDFEYQPFVASSGEDAILQLIMQYPSRWHIEEFFNLDQEMGWRRAGTQNLNIRYGKATLALPAQAAVHQLRRRLGPPYASFSAERLARELFCAIDGDIRVKKDTIVITFYNPAHTALLKSEYENLPAKLAAEGVDPRIPWLYNYKLDFRFN